MAVSFRVSIVGDRRVQTLLRNMNPALNKRITRDALLITGRAVATRARQQEMRVGSRMSPPIPSIVTVRTARLQKSIGLNRAPLPFAIHVGSYVAYAPLHELGGRRSVPTHRRKEHTRKGRDGKKHKIRAHTVRAHTANYPARPYLRPALQHVLPKMEKIFMESWLRQIDKATL